MAAEAQPALADRLERQAGQCAELGSALYAGLLERAAADVRAGGPAWEALRGHEDDPPGSALELRLMGAVHRLVLEGAAPDLAACYPSAGGAGTPERAWPAFRAVLDEQAERVRALLERPVQTNEPGRCAALLGGFLLVARETGVALRLAEIGASAGLNLRFDRYWYGGWGDPSSPVRLEGAFEGEPPPFEVAVPVADRRGCDPDALDPASEDDALTLRSYVSADQVERLERLDGALRVAREVPASVERAGAAAWLERELARPDEGRATVVFHSIVVQYLDADERATVDELLADAGARASAEAPLARLAMEPAEEGGGVQVHLTTWPSGEERLVAETGAHGQRVRWLG